MFDEGGFDAEGNVVPAPGQRAGQDLRAEDIYTLTKGYPGFKNPVQG